VEMTPQLKARDYTYRIHWSRREHGYIATVAEFPTMQSSPADTPHKAIDALMTLVAQKLHELDLDGQPVPPAFAMSGRRR
jgi:predicted RNase H-like HicB family nuclease